MNRSYLPEVNSTPRIPTEKLSRVSRMTEAILSFFDLVIDAFVAFFASSSVRTTLRVLGSAVCFFGILLVIGAVEAETLTFGAGILASLLLCAISFLCVCAPGSRRNGQAAEDETDNAE